MARTAPNLSGKPSGSLACLLLHYRVDCRTAAKAGAAADETPSITKARSDVKWRPDVELLFTATEVEMF